MRALSLIVLLCGCHDRLSSDEEAELAALGLDGAYERALTLGLRGFNAASSANIPAQADEGDLSGTMTVSGQVDQGASDNKGLRLEVHLEDYADFVDVDSDGDREIAITYDTDPEAPVDFDISLRSIPDGTLTASFVGMLVLQHDIEGAVELDLALTGDIEADPYDGDAVRPVEGSITITGTATNARDGIYYVDITL